METHLDKLLNESGLEAKDKHEIRSIYMVMDDQKKANLIANFDKVVEGIKNIKNDLREEQMILIGRALDSAEASLDRVKKSGLNKGAHSMIEDLKISL